MNTSNRFYFSLLAALFFAGCSDDDPAPGDNIQPGATLTAEMGADLSQQVYVDLSEGSMTSVDVNIWELAFENNGNAIRTNTAKRVAVATPTESNFDDVTSDVGLVYTYDSEDGDLNATALAGWQTNTPYIVDLGVDEKWQCARQEKNHDH